MLARKKTKAKAADQTRGPGRRQALVRKLTQGALLAMSLTAAPLSSDALKPEWRLFDLTVIDRLEVPLTRYRD